MADELAVDSAEGLAGCGAGLLSEVESEDRGLLELKIESNPREAGGGSDLCLIKSRVFCTARASSALEPEAEDEPRLERAGSGASGSAFGAGASRMAGAFSTGSSAAATGGVIAGSSLLGAKMDASISFFLCSKLSLSCFWLMIERVLATTSSASGLGADRDGAGWCSST